jgi:hypothetical protein
MTTVAESAPPRDARDGSLGDLAPTANRCDGVARRGDFGGFALSLIVIEAFAFSDKLLLQAAPLLDQNKELISQKMRRDSAPCRRKLSSKPRLRRIGQYGLEDFGHAAHHRSVRAETRDDDARGLLVPMQRALVQLFGNYGEQ